MNRRTSSLVAVLLMVGSMAAGAQWSNLPTKGIPRTRDGKPDLFAPAPRKPDGKPDFSGLWTEDPQDRKYFFNQAADFKPGEFPIQPWADALTKRRTPGGSEWPPANCLPAGVPVLDISPAVERPLKIIQDPDLLVILYESSGVGFRQIFLDGRTLPKDPNPTWLGYSVGRWEEHVLVVETAGFNGKTWLDMAGHPTTDALHVIERFERRDFGHLGLQLTIEDSKAYNNSWTVTLTWILFADSELMENVCNENEKDRKHMLGK